MIIAAIPCKNAPWVAHKRTLNILYVCVAGRYQNHLRHVVSRGAGRYLDSTGGNASSDCKARIAGTYADTTANDDASDCKDCAAGRFSPQTARTSAKDRHHRPYGQYQSKTGAVAYELYTGSVHVLGLCQLDRVRGLRSWPVPEGQRCTWMRGLRRRPGVRSTR